MKEQDLFKLKQEIEEAKTSVSELKGQQNALLKQLKEEWGCSTVEEAEKKIQIMKKDIEKLENSIAVGLEELEEKYHG